MKKIAVADDDPPILDALKLILEDAGYEVLTFEDSQVLLQMDLSSLDLLFLDIWMSGVNGSEICRQLKQRPDTAYLPIILLSANKDVAKIAGICGADDFLAKPFEITDLLAKVEEYL